MLRMWACGLPAFPKELQWDLTAFLHARRIRSVTARTKRAGSSGCGILDDSKQLPSGKGSKRPFAVLNEQPCCLIVTVHDCQHLTPASDAASFTGKSILFILSDSADLPRLTARTGAGHCLAISELSIQVVDFINNITNRCTYDRARNLSRAPTRIRRQIGL